MSRCRLSLVILILAAMGSGRSAEPAKDPPGLSELGLQVAALETLYEFEFTPSQLQAVLKVAKQTTPKPAPLPAVKASDEFRKALTQLRDALIDASNAELIGALQDKVADLQESEDIELDDKVEITSAARRLAPDLLKLLKPTQVMAFLNANKELISDPTDLLLEAVDKARTLPDDEWKELSAETVAETGWLLGGLDQKKARAVEQKLQQSLKQVRSMNDGDFAKKRPELEQALRQFVAQVPPTAILHNYAEHALAELLSNPQLLTALEARLRK
jgi:hypothetical protein